AIIATHSTKKTERHVRRCAASKHDGKTRRMLRPEAREDTMPDLFDTIETCRSMRRLKPDPVPDEMIAKILRAGACAPNGGNTQKWRFMVIKDPKIKKDV